MTVRPFVSLRFLSSSSSAAFLCQPTDIPLETVVPRRKDKEGASTPQPSPPRHLFLLLLLIGCKTFQAALLIINVTVAVCRSQHNLWVKLLPFTAGDAVLLSPFPISRIKATTN